MTSQTSTSSAEALGFSSNRLARLSRHISAYIERGLLVGVNALVLRRGKVAYSESFGHHAKNGAPLQVDSLFRIYSMTKPVTSVAALILYEQGRLMLDAPVTRYLPKFKTTKVVAGSAVRGLKLVEQTNPMTVRHLLTHTAGLSYGWFDDTPVDALYRATGMVPAKTRLSEFVDMLAEQPLAFQPGSAWRYSHATDVLARVVEEAADESLDSFFKTHILEPLNMQDTAFGVSAENAKRLTSVYGPSDTFVFGMDYSPLPRDAKLYPLDTPEQGNFVEPDIALNGFSGGGGLVSSISDYANFAQMLLNRGEFGGNRILSPKTVDLMTLNHIPSRLRPLEIGGFGMLGIGFGLGVSVLEDVAAAGLLGSAGLYGWGGAAMTTFWVDPAEDLVGLFMTQFMPNDFYDLLRECRVLTYAALVN